MIRSFLYVFFILIIINSTSVIAGMISLGDLYRDDNQIVISAPTGLEWLMWNHAETYTLPEWESELTDTSSTYYGWRIANIDEVFQMLYQTGLRLETFSQASLEASCYDNDQNTICNTSHSSTHTFNISVDAVKQYNFFFTGQEFGQIDALHSGLI